ncbi:MAG: type III-A CRISPR-associated protein Csm2 [Candidatus Caldarchaeum sp.]
MQQAKGSSFARPSDQDLKTIITDPDGAQKLVEWADSIGKSLKDMGLTTSQIRALFGEVRQIQAEWQTALQIGLSDPQRGERYRQAAIRRLILLQPKMAYRARKERGKAVGDLVNVLSPALNLVIEAKKDPEECGRRFQHFVEFFEAILAYHKAYGGQ